MGKFSQPHEYWDVIIYPCLNFSGSIAVEFRAWMSDYFPQNKVGDDLSLP